jgi:diacylglycerol kinase family enzyme
VRHHVVFNPKSGTALSLSLDHEALARRFADLGLDAQIDSSADDLESKIERARKSDAEIVVCAGGDGTFTAIARGLANSNKTLALLPLGTANLLARDLGIPLALDTALASLSSAEPAEIDVGEVNGLLFLHKVVVGVIPAIAAAREKVRGGGALALLRFAQYFAQRLANAQRTAVAITSRDTVDRIERVHAIAVANNSYDQGWGKIFQRTSLTGGTLTLYVLKRLTLRDVLRLGGEMLTGRWQEDTTLSIETVRSVSLRTKKKRVAAMIDGEVEFLETPLRFRIRPKALRVLVPVAPAAQTASSEDQDHADRSSLRLALRTS